MAENLGEAQLRLTVDLPAFEQSLREARALITSELANVTASGTRGRSSQNQNSPQTVRRALGGAREGIRALEIAQERRFRLARRIDELEARGADVARLRANLGRLTDTQIRRQFGSFRQVSQELARQVTLEERRLQTQRRIERAARQQASVGAQMGGARESILALERAQDRRFRISQRINRLEDRGVNVAQLRTRLGELTTSYSQRQFGTARQLSRELERQVSLTEQRTRRERAYQQTLERSARIGGPSEPIRGRSDLPGSPRFLEAQQREAARVARQQAAADRARRLESARAAQEQRRTEREAALARKAEIREGLRVGRLNASPVSGRTLDGFAIPGSPNERGKNFNLKSSWSKFLAQLQDVKRDIDAASVETSKRLRGPASPISGRLINGRVIPGSPADIERQQRGSVVRGPSLPISGRLVNGDVVPGSPADLRRRSRLQSTQNSGEALKEAFGNAIIGGAFPALFGQGLGASLGGTAGGFGGGLLGGNFGFGLSLIGTAFGQQVDVALQKLQTLGSALSDPVAKFEEIASAGLISSKSQETYIRNLIAAGREAEAQATIQADLANTYGDLSVAKELAASTDALNRSFSQLQISLAGITAGPLKQFVDLLNAGFGRKIAANSTDQLRNTLSTTDRASFDAELRKAFGSRPRGIFGGNKPLSRTELELIDPKTIAEIQRKYSKPSDSQQQSLQRAAELRRQLLATSKEQIIADTSGNKQESLRLQALQVELNLKKELQKYNESSDPEGVLRDTARAKAAEDRLRIQQQISRLEKETWAENIAAANQLKSIQEEIAIEQQRPGLTSTGTGALQAIKAIEDARRAQRNAEAALRADPQNNNLLNASQIAARQVRLAAAKTRADLLDAYDSAKKAVRSISRSIEDGVTALQELQNTSGSGLNEFRSPQQVVDNQAAVFQQLNAQAKEIATRRGLNFTLSGSLEQRNAALLRLVRGDRQETRLAQDIFQNRADLNVAQNDLSTVTQSLVNVNGQLATATAELAQKNWTVNVAVDANSGNYAINLG